MQTNDIVVERPGDLTPEWLTAAIGAGTITEFTVERIGTGQMSECYRIELTYAAGEDGPATVILKVAATDPVSRQTGLALGLYEREVRFYSEVAPRLGVLPYVLRSRDRDLRPADRRRRAGRRR